MQLWKNVSRLRTLSQAAKVASLIRLHIFQASSEVSSGHFYKVEVIERGVICARMLVIFQNYLRNMVKRIVNFLAYDHPPITNCPKINIYTNHQLALGAVLQLPAIPELLGILGDLTIVFRLIVVFITVHQTAHAINVAVNNHGHANLHVAVLLQHHPEGIQPRLEAQRITDARQFHQGVLEEALDLALGIHIAVEEDVHRRVQDDYVIVEVYLDGGEAGDAPVLADFFSWKGFEVVKCECGDAIDWCGFDD